MRQAPCNAMARFTKPRYLETIVDLSHRRTGEFKGSRWADKPRERRHAKANLPDVVPAGMTKGTAFETLSPRGHAWADVLCKEFGMSQGQAEQSATESRRKEIFLALVEAQDQEMTVAQSRKLIAERFGVEESQIRDIEREGLDNQWPPLS